MEFALFDSSGNLISSYSDESEAKSALEEIIAAEPEAAFDIALMTFDDDGAITNDPVFGTQTEAFAVEFKVTDWYSPFVDSPVSQVQGASRTTATAAKFEYA